MTRPKIGHWFGVSSMNHFPSLTMAWGVVLKARHVVWLSYEFCAINPTWGRRKNGLMVAVASLG